MELLLLFVLFTLNDDPEFKQRLHAFLGFYRENRALFASLMQKGEETPPAEKADGEKADEEKESGKPKPAFDASVLEAYLTRLAGG